MEQALPLRVLIIENQPADAELMVDELEQAGYAVSWQRVETEVDYLRHLESTFDLILADYSLPDFSAPRALQLLKASALDIPFIIVTGTVGEETAVACMKQGAADYLLKDRMARLGQAVAHTLEERQTRQAKQQAEIALQQSEARFRSVFEYAPVGIAILRENMPLFVNKFLLRMYGLHHISQLEPIGLSAFVAVPDRSEALRAATDGVFTLPVKIETRGQRRDGARFSIHIEIGIVPLPDGPAYIAFIQDITERKRLEDETRKAQQFQMELEKEREITDLKDRFMNMVSHEFRTPLSVIRVTAELLGHYLASGNLAKQRNSLDTIERQVQHIVDLLDDVLIIGKAQASKTKFNPVLLEIRPFCESLLEEVQIADNNIHKFHFITPDIPLGSAPLDPELMRHILINLLSNASKYSPLGSDIRFELQRDDTLLVIRVSDMGIGIPVDEQARLFEPFHRAKNAIKFQGTGLGLVIVKQSVELHGGKITFESETGKGTTFTVQLPLTVQRGQENQYSSNQ